MNRNSVTLTLSVECVNFIFVTVVERPPWKILVVTINLHRLKISNRSGFHIEEEMIMCSYLIQK